MELTVIITAYNKGPFIKDCLLGVLNQDFQEDFEVIVADDCSTDNTQQEIFSFKNHFNFSKVRYTRHSKNKGLMGNFIWAINQARGEYIALCDGDDVWIDSLKVKKQIDILKSDENYFGCGTKLELIDTREFNLKYTDFHFEYQESRVVAVSDFIDGLKYPFGTSTFVFRRDKLKIQELIKFRFALSYNDLILYNLIANKGMMYYLDEETVLRNHNKEGITVNDTVNELPLLLTKYWIYTKLLSILKFDIYEKIQLNTTRELIKTKLIKKLNNRSILLLFNFVIFQKPHFTLLDQLSIITHFYPKLMLKKFIKKCVV